MSPDRHRYLRIPFSCQFLGSLAHSSLPNRLRHRRNGTKAKFNALRRFRKKGSELEMIGHATQANFGLAQGNRNFATAVELKPWPIRLLQYAGLPVLPAMVEKEDALSLELAEEHMHRWKSATMRKRVQFKKKRVVDAAKRREFEPGAGHDHVGDLMLAEEVLDEEDCWLVPGAAEEDPEEAAESVLCADSGDGEQGALFGDQPDARGEKRGGAAAAAAITAAGPEPEDESEEEAMGEEGGGEPAQPAQGRGRRAERRQRAKRPSAPGPDVVDLQGGGAGAAAVTEPAQLAAAAAVAADAAAGPQPMDVSDEELEMYGKTMLAFLPDTETTGPETYLDKVTQVAAEAWLLTFPQGADSGEMIWKEIPAGGKFTSLVNTNGERVSAEITGITGITQDQVDEAPSIKEVLVGEGGFVPWMAGLSNRFRGVIVVSSSRGSSRRRRRRRRRRRARRGRTEWPGLAPATRHAPSSTTARASGGRSLAGRVARPRRAACTPQPMRAAATPPPARSARQQSRQPPGARRRLSSILQCEWAREV